MDTIELPEEMKALLRSDDAELETTQQKKKRNLVLKQKI